MSSSIVDANLLGAANLPLRPPPAAMISAPAERRPQPVGSTSAEAASATEQTEQFAQDDREERFRIAWLWNPSWLVSMLVHMILLLSLALMTLSLPEQEERASILATTTPTDELIEEFDEESLALETDPADEDQSLHSEEEAELTDSLDTLSASQLEVPIDAFAESVPQVTAPLPSLLNHAEFGEELDTLEDLGSPIEFYGSQIQGNVAVVFDVTASMYGSIPLVLKEIDRKFSNAQVVAVHGATFKPYGTPRLVPYRSNAEVYQYMLKNTSRSPANLPKLAIVHQELLSLKRCQSLGAEGMLQSLGTAIEALLKQLVNRPSTIFVFSDFQDGIDRKYLQSVQELAIRRKVRIVVYHPTKFVKDRAVYEAFAKATGGELRETLPK